MMPKFPYWTPSMHDRMLNLDPQATGFAIADRPETLREPALLPPEWFQWLDLYFNVSKAKRIVADGRRPNGAIPLAELGPRMRTDFGVKDEAKVAAANPLNPPIACPLPSPYMGSIPIDGMHRICRAWDIVQAANLTAEQMALTALRCHVLTSQEAAAVWFDVPDWFHQLQMQVDGISEADMAERIREARAYRGRRIPVARPR